VFTAARPSDLFGAAAVEGVDALERGVVNQALRLTGGGARRRSGYERDVLVGARKRAVCVVCCWRSRRATHGARRIRRRCACGVELPWGRVGVARALRLRLTDGSRPRSF
jgi:hypothetical protein